MQTRGDTNRMNTKDSIQSPINKRVRQDSIELLRLVAMSVLYNVISPSPKPTIPYTSPYHTTPETALTPPPDLYTSLLKPVSETCADSSAETAPDVAPDVADVSSSEAEEEKDEETSATCRPTPEYGINASNLTHLCSTTEEGKYPKCTTIVDYKSNESASTSQRCYMIPNDPTFSTKGYTVIGIVKFTNKTNLIPVKRNKGEFKTYRTDIDYILVYRGRRMRS